MACSSSDSKKPVTSLLFFSFLIPIPSDSLSALRILDTCSSLSFSNSDSFL
ncbi:hypothetical protein glysoja_031375 [Glycine soja]|uniref:Uncharacterized protein n=1 Tax=Glycine soja TaxID=3848 RepID=A0A0B2SLJ2_GLYSO|nr:hypothetical protein glysoja_031375 [Glycine soja]